jgi:hypothetical protein
LPSTNTDLGDMRNHIQIYDKCGDENTINQSSVSFQDRSESCLNNPAGSVLPRPRSPPTTLDTVSVS